MLLEFKGEHPNDEGLCSSQQRRSIAALGLLLVIFTGLIFIALSQSCINKQLKNSDLMYENGLYFGVLADIHLDLNQNETHCRDGNSMEGEWIVHSPNLFGAQLCDLSLNMLNITVLELKKIEVETGPFEFILVLGDQVGHRIEGLEPSLESINKVHNLISAQFPFTPVYFVLGNHDIMNLQSVAPDENEIEQWYSSISQSLFAGFYTTKQQFLSAAATFDKYGFYKIEHNPFLWVVALNTNPFQIGSNVTLEIVDAQFDWLNETLHHAEDQKSVSVLLIGHSAPEIKFLDLTRWNSNKNMTWKSDCITKFNNIVGRFSSVIKLSFFAHQHTDSWFAGRNSKGDYINHFIMPPVSPVGRGHPSFTIGVTNEEWDLLDLQFYHSPMEQLSRVNQTPRYFFQYSFKEQNFQYDEKYAPINGTLLDGLTSRIIDFEDGMETYTARLLNTYQYHYKPHVSPHQMFCVLTENTSVGLQACLRKYFL